MPRFRVEQEVENGWSRWVPPQMKGYRMACCDCGLVHEMDFQVVKVLKRHRDGAKTVQPLPAGKYMVEFRTRRHNRSTAAHRREKKKHGNK